MKRACLLAATLALLLAPRGALAADGNGIAIEIGTRFLQSASIAAEWAVEYTDAEGGPATEDNWVRMTLTAHMSNASSQGAMVEWRLPAEVTGVVPLTEEAMKERTLGLNESFDVKLRFARNPEVPLPEGGMKLEFVTKPQPD